MFYAALRRLAPNGAIFCYDMQLLDPPELGATPRRSIDMRLLLQAIFDALGSAYRPSVLEWTHTKVRGWSFLIDERYPQITFQDIERRRETCLTLCRKTVEEILISKFDECTKILESFYARGTSNQDEVVVKSNAVYDFWSLSRILNRAKS